MYSAISISHNFMGKYHIIEHTFSKLLTSSVGPDTVLLNCYYLHDIVVTWTSNYMVPSTQSVGFDSKSARKCAFLFNLLHKKLFASWGNTASS
jgi:hypothetical protein